MSDISFPGAATPNIRDLLVAMHKFSAGANPPLSITSLSTVLFGSGRQIARLEEGCDLTTGRLRTAWTRLRELQAGGPRTRKKQQATDAR